VSRDEMNKIILNYLIIEGYHEAVIKFIKETGTKEEFDEELLIKRTRIRTLILSGKINETINEINKINKEILRTNPEIFFDLQKQNLIKIIKENKVDEALDFAQNEIFPLIKEDDALIKELQKLMVLFAYEDFSKSPYKDSGTIDQLKALASKVNKQILIFHKQYKSKLISKKDLILPSMFKIMFYYQNQLNKSISFPEIINVCPLEYKLN
jgi:hypothetical protein